MMSNYDPQSWQVPTREVAWDQGPPSGMGQRYKTEPENGTKSYNIPGSLHPMHQQQPQSYEQLGAFGTQIEGTHIKSERCISDAAKSHLAHYFRRLIAPQIKGFGKLRNLEC